MGASTTAASKSDSLLNLPESSLGYVALVAAVLAGVVKLPMSVFVPDQTLQILFLLNALGFLGGVGLYLTRYWRQELYYVAAGYALLTIVALFVVEGFGVEAFFREGSLNPLAVLAKTAEAVLAATALALARQ